MRFDEFDKIIVSFSGGKDSLCLMFFALERFDTSKIELWHQAIDGRGASERPFFDWPSTPGYVEYIADLFGLPLHWQWRKQGFYGELLKENKPSEAICYEFPNGEVRELPSHSKPNTRLKWPAKSADLRKGTRWCSPYLKIDPARRVIVDRFQSCERVLFLTGERREESAARSKYDAWPNHPANSSKRTVYHWRPLLDMPEKDVWEKIKAYNVQPHPAYYLGFPRLSCRSCIFYNKNHWATLQEVAPGVITRLARYERWLGHTIDNRLTLPEMVRLGQSLLVEENVHWIDKATEQYDGPVDTVWSLPAGAFGAGGGSL